jgi:hypothetical protein
MNLWKFGPRGSSREGERGQVLALMVGGLLAVVILVGLVIDGGNLWAQQRIVQNGADAAAEAGAIVMAERLAGATEPAGGWDARVAGRIAASATANGLTNQVAYYTDICGIPLTSTGTAALNGDGTEDLASAAQVGSGIPNSSAISPDCPNTVVGPPAGVLVLGNKDARTYFASAMGFGTIGVGQRATAVAGYLQGVCDATQGNECALLPITIPVNVVTCDGQNRALNTSTPWARHVVYKIPLCGNSPGNVGWLDWFPPHGGAGEISCSIENPNNPPFNLPSWQYVMETGNVNGGGGNCGAESVDSVEDEVREYNGQIVYIPMFDVMCGDTPDQSQVEVQPNYGCPPDELDGGNGNNLWYRFPNLAYFELCDPSIPECNGLQGAYMQGNNQAECESGGNGATSCLVGQFTDILGAGTVGAGQGGGSTAAKALGVQLIK